MSESHNFPFETHDFPFGSKDQICFRLEEARLEKFQWLVKKIEKEGKPQNWFSNFRCLLPCIPIKRLLGNPNEGHSPFIMCANYFDLIGEIEISAPEQGTRNITFHRK